MLCVGWLARYHEGSSTETYVLLAEPGGAKRRSTSSSLSRKDSISLIISRWWAAGSKPLCCAHSAKLLRVDRRLRSSSAAATELVRSGIGLNSVSNNSCQLCIAH